MFVRAGTASFRIVPKKRRHTHTESSTGVFQTEVAPALSCCYIEPRMERFSMLYTSERIFGEKMFFFLFFHGAHPSILYRLVNIFLDDLFLILLAYFTRPNGNEYHLVGVCRLDKIQCPTFLLPSIQLSIYYYEREEEEKNYFCLLCGYSLLDRHPSLITPTAEART